MKQATIKKYLLSTIFSLLFFSLILPPAYASIARASEYLRQTYADINASSGGNLSIEFYISGWGITDKIGATEIYLYEDSGNGFEEVAEYSYLDDEYSYMLSHNTLICSESVPYVGIPGCRYYADVHFFAGNEDGSDTYSTTTSTVIAR